MLGHGVTDDIQPHIEAVSIYYILLDSVEEYIFIVSF